MMRRTPIVVAIATATTLTLAAAAQAVTDLPKAVTLDAAIAGFTASDIAFEHLPFAHPLYILFSSGTTGIPKCIVHSAGGTLIQHVKEHRLHAGIVEGVWRPERESATMATSTGHPVPIPCAGVSSSTRRSSRV